MKTPESKRKKRESKPSDSSSSSSSSENEDVDEVTIKSPAPFRASIRVPLPAAPIDPASTPTLNEAELRKKIRDEVMGELFFAMGMGNKQIRERIDAHIQTLTRLKLELARVSSELSDSVDTYEDMQLKIDAVNQQIMDASNAILDDYQLRFQLNMWDKHLRENPESRKADSDFKSFQTDYKTRKAELDETLKQAKDLLGDIQKAKTKSEADSKKEETKKKKEETKKTKEEKKQTVKATETKDGGARFDAKAVINRLAGAFNIVNDTGDLYQIVDAVFDQARVFKTSRDEQLRADALGGHFIGQDELIKLGKDAAPYTDSLLQYMGLHPPADMKPEDKVRALVEWVRLHRKLEPRIAELDVEVAVEKKLRSADAQQMIIARTRYNELRQTFKTKLVAKNNELRMEKLVRFTEFQSKIQAALESTKKDLVDVFTQQRNEFSNVVMKSLASKLNRQRESFEKIAEVTDAHRKTIQSNISEFFLGRIKLGDVITDQIFSSPSVCIVPTGLHDTDHGYCSDARMVKQFLNGMVRTPHIWHLCKYHNRIFPSDGRIQTITTPVESVVVYDTGI